MAAYQLAGMGALPIDYTSIGAFNIYPVSKDIEVHLPIQIACCCPLIILLTVIGLAASSSFDSEPVPSGFAVGAAAVAPSTSLNAGHMLSHKFIKPRKQTLVVSCRISVVFTTLIKAPLLCFHLCGDGEIPKMILLLR